MRLFIAQEPFDQSDNRISISEKRIVRHAHVVRLTKGDQIAVQSGETRYHGTIESLTKNSLTLTVDSITPTSPQSLVSPQSISIAIALPNTGPKLDLIVEKLTEVGVSQIIFFPAQRSQIRKLDPKKLDKLSLKALEASEQSNRRTVPQISFVKYLDEVLAMEGEKVLFHKSDNHSYESKNTSSIIGLVGPEGGRSDEELTQMNDLPTMNLGNTILRMETAAIVGARALMHTLS